MPRPVVASDPKLLGLTGGRVLWANAGNSITLSVMRLGTPAHPRLLLQRPSLRHWLETTSSNPSFAAAVAAEGPHLHQTTAGVTLAAPADRSCSRGRCDAGQSLLEANKLLCGTAVHTQLRFLPPFSLLPPPKNKIPHPNGEITHTHVSLYRPYTTASGT